MPLSEHEQRLLEQIEQQLYAEDPKFASFYRTTDLRHHYRRQLYRYAAGFVVGLGLLLAGVITTVIAMGVAGFVVMLGSLVLGMSAWQRFAGRTSGPRGVVGSPARPRGRFHRRRRRGARGPRVSWRARLEHRWEQRWERGDR